ncbi:hypothetical protein PCIT_a1529 [Pseudoalteromonas citrea]|uniref:Uncharacterized protein n=2 Tax=Pseudoalteromonas citrea TaxID=43655 RepID=A0AAD4AM98_9GAMM|nr:hypothetical protein [Pseudoalteromonas citrea]KAF7775355.1 hypothetical protein PCIT_a1529 [Pseudoalteromonas citrea]
MKPISLYLICVFFSSCALSNYTQPLYKDMFSWFKTPAAITPWQLQQSGQQWMLRATTMQDGGGHVFFNRLNQRCVVSVPHQFFDMGTLPIGQFIYDTLCQVMVSNSHQRYVKSPDTYPMDFSKRPYNIHNAALVAYQAHNINAKVFQIHGFSNKKRRTKQGKSAEVIVSQGKTSNLTGKQLTTCFSQLGFNAFLYGTSINELGGTKNIVHKLGLQPHSFIHIELNKVTRSRLRQNPSLLKKFTTCLSRTI